MVSALDTSKYPRDADKLRLLLEIKQRQKEEAVFG
jgi:hypothetical protein